MCDLILIFSRCEKKIKDNYQFHFKGVYCGKKIKNLLISDVAEGVISIDSDYLLWTRKVDLIDGVLKVKLIKSKKIL